MRPIARRTRDRRGWWLSGCALGALAALPLAAATLDPAHDYQVRGDLVVTVDGPNCCGNTRFTGSFHAAYSVTSSGGVRVGGISFELDDRIVVVRGGFLDLFSETMTVSCASGSTLAPATGWVAGPETLKLAAGSIHLSGGFAEGRDSDGGCVPQGITFAGDNTDEVVLLHRPGSGRVELHAGFSAVLEDDSIYVLHLDGEGHFDNRPPVADLAFRYPNGVYPQGGCPAFQHCNAQGCESVAEANTPQGLLAYLRSFSSDPDGVASARADILADRWLDERGGAEDVWLADGRDVGPFLFEWGPTHNVQLLTSDYAGAAAVEACAFRVIDTTAPTVAAPAALITGCSTSGGATGATSPPLAAFLAGATATDVVDSTPTPLAPRLGAVDVIPTTLLPADGLARNVGFRFRDDAANVGEAASSVTVVDNVAPSATVTVDRPLLGADHKFWSIAVGAALGDDCGGPVSLRLLSIGSNAPAFDASDILDAAIGADDRAFFLFSRLAAPGVARVYTVRYEAKDAAGNARVATATVTVTPDPELVATFDAALQAPQCTAVGRSCDSGATLVGRNTLGPEPNRPNTIGDSCADGPAGSFHVDESNDRIKVATTDGLGFAPGKTVRIDATVWAYSSFASDHLDLFYAANASSPSWIYVTTLTPATAGLQTLGATYTLPPGTLQAVRARFRYNGGPSPCAAGSYDDHDDLVFAVR